MPQSETKIWEMCLKYSRTWNAIKLRYWVEVAAVACVDNEADRLLLESYIKKVRELAAQCEMVYPVVARGVVSVDYDNCSIAIEKEIPFAPRKEPDSTAEFIDGREEEVEEMIMDLAIVVKAFNSPMVVEGCTGG